MQPQAFDAEISEILHTAYDDAVAAMEQLRPMRGATEKAQAKTQMILSLIQAAEHGEHDRARLCQVANQAMAEALESVTLSRAL